MSTQTIGAMHGIRPVNNLDCKLLRRRSLQIGDSNSGLLLHKTFTMS